MDIYKRAGYLGDMLSKQAEAAYKPSSPLPKSKLFPKLTGPNKPPDLTNNSQAKVNLNKTTPNSSLPDIKVKGISPKFKPRLNTANPYNKTM